MLLLLVTSPVGKGHPEKIEMLLPATKYGHAVFFGHFNIDSKDV